MNKLNKNDKVISRILNGKIKKITPMHEGVSNKSYLVNDKYVVRVKEEKEHFYSYQQEKDILKKTAKEYLSEVVIYLDKDGNKVSEYIPNTHIFKGTTKEIKLAAQMLNKLHNSKAKTRFCFHPFTRYLYYKRKAKHKGFPHESIVLKEVKKIYRKYPLVICHNDCVDNNFLYTPTKSYLIDYEYASRNIALFDLASFLSENKITSNAKRKIFLDAYNFNYEYHDDLMYMIYFENMLWYYWALERYNSTKKEIYLNISKDKEKAINSDINSVIKK